MTKSRCERHKDSYANRRQIMGGPFVGICLFLLKGGILAGCGSASQTGQSAKPTRGRQGETINASRDGKDRPRSARKNSRGAAAEFESESERKAEAGYDSNGSSEYEDDFADDDTAPVDASETSFEKTDASSQVVEDPVQNSPKLSIGGARASGFFARGAPVLTAEQIAAGVEIEASCEGGSHPLVITAAALKTLAAGESVVISSGQNAHFGNPTNHRHDITYTPIDAAS